MPARWHGHGVLVVKMIRPITLSFLVLIAYGAGAQDNGADPTILAAERGDAAYQFILGIEYANGRGRPRDLFEAAKWFRLAAEQGHNEAQYRLGSMYAEGEGVLGDNAEAAKWYRLALEQYRLRAEQGDVWGQLRLGVMYYMGQGVPQDRTEAVKWYRLAAEQGDGSAQFTLAIMYETGDGVLQDHAEAIRWYRLAADREMSRDVARGITSTTGHAEAQYNLGLKYDLGRDVPQDFVEAIRWYRLAADQGHAKASVALRRMGGCPYEPGSRELSQEKQKIIAKLNRGICQMALDNDFHGISRMLRGIGKNYVGEEITVLEAYPYIRCSGFFTLDLDLLRVIAQYPSRDLLMIYLISYLADEQACSPTFLRKLVTCRKDMFERSDCLNIFEHIDHKRRKHSQSPNWVERYNRFESYLNDKVNQLGGPIRDARFCALINEPAHCSAGG